MAKSFALTMLYGTIGSLLLALLTTGCAPRLGAHVHRYSYRGQTYYGCHVVADERDSQLAHSALAICQEAIDGHVPAYQNGPRSRQDAPGATK
jgi:hypothetical protein